MAERFVYIEIGSLILASSIRGVYTVINGSAQNAATVCCPIATVVQTSGKVLLIINDSRSVDRKT